MKLNEITQSKTLNPPSISVGDEVKVGKFKNRKAEVKGFTKDDNGQPVLKTTKGDQKLYKPRVTKLEPKKNKLDEISKREFVDRLSDPLHSAIIKVFDKAERVFNEEGYDFEWIRGGIQRNIAYTFLVTIQENTNFASVETAHGQANHIAEEIFLNSRFNVTYGLILRNTLNSTKAFEFTLIHANKRT